MNKMRWLNRLMAAVSLVLIAGCGGGGGGSSLYGGNGPPPAPTAASISLDLGGVTSITNSGSNVVTVTVTAKDSSNVVVAGVPVSITATQAEVTRLATATDSAGKVTATVAIGDNKSNRTIQITATSGALSVTQNVSVTGARIKATAVPSVLAPGVAGQVQYQVVDVNDNPIALRPITVTSTVKTETATTDANGVFTYSYTAPTAAGDLTVSASSAGVNQSTTITVQPVSGGSTKPNVLTGSILSASVEANPSVVTVNTTGSTLNRAAVRALFQGANNASIANVRVRFDLGGDPNSVGGSFDVGSSLVYSDVNGEATSFYVPASKASPTNGVTVRACYGYTDAEMAGGACPNQVTTTLTVASGAVAVTIGTNNRLLELNNGLQLGQDFIVTVNDSAGRAKAGVDIVPSVDLVSFGKGFYFWGTTSSGDEQWLRSAPQYFGAPDGSGTGACWNEDRNRNNIIESSEDSTILTYGPTQGGNGNGVLDPAKSDVVITVNGGTSAKTDSTGSVVVRITYPRNLAGWLKYNILVSAGGVSGTEARANWLDILGVPAADIAAEVEPAFVRSRYGIQAGCQNPN